MKKKKDPCCQYPGRFSAITMMRVRVWNPTHTIDNVNMQDVENFKFECPAFAHILKVRGRAVLVMICGRN